MINPHMPAIQLGSLHIQSQYARPAIVETAAPEIHTLFDQKSLDKIISPVEAIEPIQAVELEPVEIIPVQDPTKSYGASVDPAPAGYYDRGWCTFGAWTLAPWVGKWGDAASWDDNARVDGFTVSDAPVVGSVFVDNSGKYGHVGYVLSVSEGQITVKDMNFSGFGKWTVRTVPVDSYIYIYPPA